MFLRSGQSIGAYQVTALLGCGGMGEVYRARDTRLGRDVALKVLPAAVTAEPGRLERFDREARAIATLNHPNIVTIYSTEEADGVRFLTMELVEGTTLDQFLAGKGLPLARFLEIALPLADALAAAHQKHITHRDLKPGNVMLSHDGRVKVLDFGLARIEGPGNPDDGLGETIAPITCAGMVVGTMPYMSPEQVEGRALDPRTDLFSLGILFYEMLSGDRPFKGTSAPALMSAILRDPAPDIRAQRPDLPAEVARLIGRCLAKRPDDRVQTARDVFNELRQIQVQRESEETVGSAAAPTAASLWIAVLPFSARGAGAESEDLADALTEDVTAGLSKFSGLRVVAPQSARTYRNSPLDVGQIAEHLGARYILIGHVRTSTSAVRVGAQVVDAHTGAHLWSETYNRTRVAEDLFAIQDDVTDRIVATVADRSGILVRSMVRSIREDGAGTTASQLLLRSWALEHDPTPTDHAALRTAVESALETRPEDADLWATLANLYIVEHSLWFNPLPDPLRRAERAARRAIELDPANQQGWQWLALTCFHLRDRHGLEEALERAIRINARNANTLAWMGNILTHTGDYDRGCALTERAMAINPGHPGWLHFAEFNRCFAAGQYAEALTGARRVNIREFMWMHFAIAAAAGRLGRLEEARAAAAEMIRLAPFLGDPAKLREFIERWYWPQELVDALVEGVSIAQSREVGPGAEPSAARAHGPLALPGTSAGGSRTPPAGSLRSGIAVAVRPFTSSGAEMARTVAEALTSDVATGLARFSYVRLIGGSGASRAGASTERYAVEGEVRASGGSVRINARLVDVASGVHAWADSYNRDSAMEAFALVDDVASRIVATIADGNGALLRAFSSTPLEGRDAAVMSLLLRFFAYTQHFTPADHAWLRDGLNALVDHEPGNSRAWAYLGMVYAHEGLFGFNALPRAGERAQEAADRAVALDAANQSAWATRAMAAFVNRDLIGFRAAAERAIELNPLHSLTLATMGVHIAYAGEPERGAALVRRGMSLNPNHPGWFHIALFLDAYRLGEADAALMHAKRVTMPHIPTAALLPIAAAGRFDRAADARSGLEELSRRHPDLLEHGHARAALGRWIWDAALLDSVLEGVTAARLFARV